MKEGDDIKALAKGGRTNFFGFLLRLAARLPFLFIAGRVYGAEALGRFAYAIIIVEFVATLATLGLKRGLAEQLSATDRPHVHVVWDALLVGAIASAVAATILGMLPQIMFPNSGINGLEWLLPLTIFALAWSDISLAALAYRLDIGATVRARSVIEPWTISIAAFALSYYSLRDGLIIAYVISMGAAVVASIWPLMKSFGWPHGWRPRPASLFMLARRNVPLAAADAIEWGSRRLDIAILGLFFSPAIVGIYYVAQQVASLPQKLKTSFDPILGPVITRNLEAGNRAAVAQQVRQVGFWIIAAQAAIGLALGIPGEGVMGLVGPNFVAGTTALAFLLIAEVVAATAAVSESALIYVARHLNLWISMGMIGIQAALSFAFVLILRDEFGVPTIWQAAGPALALACALGIASIMKARLLSTLLGAPVSGWRWPLVWATAAAGVVGYLATRLPEWLELSLGIPAILAVFGLVVWRFGFTSEDRTLFRFREK
ncbi:lipopolysaccharide biosynthesis protein [Sphingomonadaceae bacterium G21617-S1]|uniref:lipopolysaccharide biosynthesis protein n=1 Tax=Rhizorhabdus sp. TaxID=1968843 RepID=UPI001215F5D7|nr:lipopolysaccharide biosynthesis protein [Rhizorhabdus sp.]MBD3762031.1 lipopolysaccharide biosynthesis protein [Rhizorhabdus sp.]MCZ4343245.1 lipopolysaccharide biosynthesis protein [Sphingomonadaceae bacterium G21617-S1]TAK09242.1 MAG: lipopolysaccharide biosynthesis protein [Rhizorhabdus sp.]